MTTLRTLVVLLVLSASLSACSLLGRSGKNSVVGEWSYRVEAPEEVYTGNLVVTKTDAGVAAAMQSDQPIGALTVTNTTFDGGILMFDVDGPQSGRLKVKATLDGDLLIGTVDNLTYDVAGMPLMATRK
ncbi:MAG: hypothetical protein R2834_07310 [Rhodothermales bacterium]